jgi:hypothetical protein
MPDGHKDLNFLLLLQVEWEWGILGSEDQNQQTEVDDKCYINLAMENKLKNFSQKMV